MNDRGTSERMRQDSNLRAAGDRGLRRSTPLPYQTRPRIQALMGVAGVQPATFRLRGGCCAVELHPCAGAADRVRIELTRP